MVTAIKLMVEDGEVRIPGTAFGWEDGQAVYALELNNKVWIGTQAAALEELAQRLTTARQAAATYEEALGRAQAGFEQDVDENYPRKV